jgi:hypothetical protein
VALNDFKDSFENFTSVASSNHATIGSNTMCRVGSTLETTVAEAMQKVAVFDMHTHLFPLQFAGLALWGIDELLTYHYLEAEFFRVSSLSPAKYFALGKRDRADQIWQTLFVERLPLSDACCGVVSVLQAFGLPVDAPDLRTAREFFCDQDAKTHMDQVFELAGVRELVMTNDPLDPAELPFWSGEPVRDVRFHAALRLDRLLNGWDAQVAELNRQGFPVTPRVDDRTVGEVRRFLAAWTERFRPVYMAASLPDSFLFPEDSARAQLLEQAVLPSCREYGIPLALMIGVKREVNPAIGIAADGMGRADLSSVASLCREFPRNRFLVTALSLENQHELNVCARKFSNLMPFGCWWFLNNGSIVATMTRQRLEMLGTSFIPQHSDARVAEQLIYKWRDARRVIGGALADSYERLQAAGRPVASRQVDDDVHRLMHGNFQALVKEWEAFA